MLTILVLTFLLPSVLGDCCLPSLFEATVFYSEDAKVPLQVVHSFDKNKMIAKPQSPYSEQAFILTDYNAKMVYTKNRDGSCEVVPFDELEDGLLFEFPQCPQNLTNSNGNWAIADNDSVDTYAFSTGVSVTHLALSSQKCNPVVSINDNDGDATTLVFVNVKVGKDANEKELDQDLTACAEEA